MKIDSFLNFLNKTYPDASCSLTYSKDYELLIKVMLSAQTSDLMVNRVSNILFNKYKTLDELKKAKQKDIEKIIAPLGMYKKKASNIIDIARSIDKGIPRNREELMKLSGIGRKCANVVLMELYNQPYIATDTHVLRISKRIGIAKESDKPIEVEEKLMAILPKNKLKLINHQLIEFGRHVCKAKNPNCNLCPLKNDKILL